MSTEDREKGLKQNVDRKETVSVQEIETQKDGQSLDIEFCLFHLVLLVWMKNG